MASRHRTSPLAVVFAVAVLGSAVAGYAPQLVGMETGTDRPDRDRPVRTGSLSALIIPRDMGRLAREARAERTRHGIPVSVTMGQAILESGAGRSGLARRYNNLFGVKCGSSGHGPYASGCAGLPTVECEPTCRTTRALFRVYASPENSVRDYGSLLSTRRYAGARRHRDDPAAFVAAVVRAGYATDPNYVGKWRRIVQDYGLRRYDR